MEWEKQMIIEGIHKLLPEAALDVLECVYYFILRA